VWAFDPQLAQAITAGMLQGDASALDDDSCADAVSEISNMMLGNATGALAECGYPLEIAAPRTSFVHRGAAVALAQRTLSIVVHTNAGAVNVLFGLSERPEPPGAGSS
jgi:CheY-specific phosphatase CheX